PGVGWTGGPVRQRTGGADGHFVAPASPATKYRWKARKSSTGGSAKMIAAAITSDQGVDSSPKKLAIPMLPTQSSDRLMTSLANMYSFQAAMKANTPVAITPGNASGSVMRKSTPSRVQPSTRPESSTSSGIVSNIDLSIQVAT